MQNSRSAGYIVFRVNLEECQKLYGTGERYKLRMFHKKSKGYLYTL